VSNPTRRRSSRRARLTVLSMTLLLAASCGAGGGAEEDWYYHWSCNGDPECLALGPGSIGQPSGTINEGPEYAMCAGLLNFAARFWNMPPATNSCDHSPSPPPGPPSIAGFTPDSGAPGTPITITGASFPVGGAGLTVTIGGLPAAVTSATTTQLVVLVPALGNSTSFITVTTPGGTATSTTAFTVVVPDPLGGAAILAIARGSDHACAILAGGTVRCWGGNSSGQLGDGTTVASTAAVAVVGIENAIDVTAGNAFSCAVVEAVAGDGLGGVRCWGRGASGQLGNGAGASASTPVAVSGVSTATQVSARAAHACALLARNGGIVCWGEHEGKKTLGLRVTWDKRYITLGPVASLLGLAFRLYDPEKLLGGKADLGITCALVPTSHPGVNIGRRHLPLNAAFQNGPNSGRDVFMPIDWIIGGNPLLEGVWFFGNGMVCFKTSYDFFMIALDGQEDVERMVREIKGLLPQAA